MTAYVLLTVLLKVLFSLFVTSSLFPPALVFITDALLLSPVRSTFVVIDWDWVRGLVSIIHHIFCGKQCKPQQKQLDSAPPYHFCVMVSWWFIITKWPTHSCDCCCCNGFRKGSVPSMKVREGTFLSVSVSTLIFLQCFMFRSLPTTRDKVQIKLIDCWKFEIRCVFVTGRDFLRQPCRVLAHPGSALRRGFLHHTGTHTHRPLTSGLWSLCWPLTSLRTQPWLWRRWLSTAESSLEPSSVRTSTSATERRDRWKHSNSARADLWPRPSRWDGDRCRMVRQVLLLCCD